MNKKKKDWRLLQVDVMKIETNLLELRNNIAGIYSSFLFGYKSNLNNKKEVKIKHTLETLRKKVNSVQHVIETTIKNEEKKK